MWKLKVDNDAYHKVRLSFKNANVFTFCAKYSPYRIGLRPWSQFNEDYTWFKTNAITLEGNRAKLD